MQDSFVRSVMEEAEDQDEEKCKEFEKLSEEVEDREEAKIDLK